MRFVLPFEWWIGLRYTRAVRRAGQNRFISFISLISMMGIALGVAALIVVLSVMNGFQKEVRDRMLSVLPHIEILTASGEMPDWREVSRDIRLNQEVRGVAPYVAGQSMVARGEVLSGVAVRGVLPSEEATVSSVVGQVKQGRFDALTSGGFNIVIGHELARSLGVSLGDRITLVVPQGQMTLAGVIPRLKQFNVVGIFEVGHYEYDSSLVFIHLDDAMSLFRMSAPSGVRIRVEDMQRAPNVAWSLSTILHGDLLIRDWSKQNRHWFIAVQTEKRMMFLILMLIIAVAAFNLVSTLVMTVTDKRADIAILRTLGASPLSVMKIFMIQGSLIGLLGTALGAVSGIVLAWNIDVIVPFIEHLLRVQFLPKDVYLITALPSDLHWGDVGVITSIALILSFLATIYPSWRAARINPAEALRYE